MNNENSKSDDSVRLNVLPCDFAYSVLRMKYLDFTKKISQNKADEINSAGIIIVSDTLENGMIASNTYAFGSFEDILSALILALTKKIKECITDKEPEKANKELNNILNAFSTALNEELS